MSIINKDYFSKTSGGLFHLPNLDLGGVEGEKALKQLQECIDVFEPEILRETMGNSLYLAFVAGLIPVPTSGKWFDLLGKLADSTTKKSPIANYVFCKMFQSIPGLSCNIKNETDQVIDFDSVKFRIIYNEMVNQLELVQDWISDNLTTYTEFKHDYNMIRFDKYQKLNALGI